MEIKSFIHVSDFVNKRYSPCIIVILQLICVVWEMVFHGLFE